RPIPVEPLKGQMLAVATDQAHPVLRHAVMGDDVYLVPRGEEIVVGATAERVGFDLSVQRSVVQSLRRSAAHSVRRLPMPRSADRGPAFGQPRRTCSPSLGLTPTFHALSTPADIRRMEFY